MPRFKAHFKTFLSLENHRKMKGVYSDSWLLAAWLRVGMMATERWAQTTNDSFLVNRTDIQILAGKRRHDAALKLLKRLAKMTPISIDRVVDFDETSAEDPPDVRRTSDERPPDVRRTSDERPPDVRRTSAGLPTNVWRIIVPNYAKRQGFEKSIGGVRDTHSNSNSNSNSKTPHTPRKRGASTSSKRGISERKKQGKIAKEMWPELVERASRYGAAWPVELENQTARDLIVDRLISGSSREDLGNAITGFIALHDPKKKRDDDKDMMKWFRATTIYRPTKFPEYLEAFETYVKGRGKSREDQDVERMEKAYQLELENE